MDTTTKIQINIYIFTRERVLQCGQKLKFIFVLTRGQFAQEKNKRNRKINQANVKVDVKLSR